MELKIIFPDGSWTNSLWVTPLGDNLYRAEESTMSMGQSEQVIRYGDVFEVEVTSDVEGRFRRIVQPSPNRTSMRLIPPEWVSSSKFEKFSQRLLKLGGYWELVFGGIFIVHIPPGAEFNLEQELKDLAKTA